MIGRPAGGVRSLEGQMMNSRAPEIKIYLRTYLCAPFQRCGVNSSRARSALVVHEQINIVATRLVWTAVIPRVILNSSETSGRLSNGRTLNVQLTSVYINQSILLF